MSQYMLLLYASEVEGEELAEREAEIPTMWSELNRSLEEAGLLAAAGRLHPTATATTVSAISGETELTDGPFAITKEALAGYYLIEAENLDQALGVARRIPLIRYGHVEVRPVMDGPPPVMDGPPPVMDGPPPVMDGPPPVMDRPVE